MINYWIQSVLRSVLLVRPMDVHVLQILDYPYGWGVGGSISSTQLPFTVDQNPSQRQSKNGPVAVNREAHI